MSTPDPQPRSESSSDLDEDFETLEERLSRCIRQSPVSVAVAIGMLVLFVAVEWSLGNAKTPEQRLQLSRQWGLIEPLVFTQQKELSGPFDVWAGQWWRIPATMFHHGGGDEPVRLLTAIVLIGGLLYLGSLLEPELGSRLVALFVVSGGLIGLSTELMFGHVVRGSAGAVYTLFGLAAVRAWQREAFRDRFGSEVFVTGMLVLIGFFIFREGEHSRPPALAAAIGFYIGVSYGAFFEMVTWPWARRMWCWFALPLVTVSCIALATMPEWLGDYHWYLAQSTNVREERIVHLQRAVDADASLTHCWQTLSGLTFNSGLPLDGWRIAIEGLDRNRTSRDLLLHAREVYLRLTPEQRIEADRMLRERFGATTDDWEQRLALQDILEDIEGIAIEPIEDDREDLASHFLIENLGQPEPEALPLTAPQADPDDLRSAAEGELL